MKKIICSGLAALLLGVFLLPLTAHAGVAGQYLDQKNEDTSAIGGSMTINNYNRVQTFVPTVTKITSIDLYLRDKVPGNVLTVTVKKISDGTVVAAATTSVPFGQEGPVGWMTISYDQPFPTVVPCTEYGIYATIPGDTQTKWGWTPGNLYPAGEATGFANTDFLFSVWGTNLEGTPKTCATVTPTTATTSTTLAKPVLTKYEKNGQTFNSPFDAEVSLEQGDKLKLVGTSSAGAAVTVSVGKKTYTANVVANGDWTAEIPASELALGSQKITAQAKKGDVSSETADLLNIKVLTAKTETAATSPEENKLMLVLGDFRVLGGLAALLVALIGLLVFLELKFHGLAKLFKKKAPKIPVENNPKE